MKRIRNAISDWKFAYEKDSIVTDNAVRLFTPADAGKRNMPVYEAKVPGSLELDLMRLGLLPDITKGSNILLVQELEDRHVWYFSEFTTEKESGYDTFLVFGGIDTAAEIFIDGNLWGFSENMLVEYRQKLDIPDGKHTLTVHIIPTAVYCAEKSIPPYCRAHEYSYDQLKIRKAPYMFGWDIMPRVVSAGIWKSVYVEKLPAYRIEDVFLHTDCLTHDRADITVNCSLSGVRGFGKTQFRITGQCGNSRFDVTKTVYSSSFCFTASVKDPCLWMPVNYGEPHLYRIRCELLADGEILDSRELQFGIRTVGLERTSCVGEDGKFLFRINGKKVFCMGSNWVPTDIFPANQAKLNLRGLEMVSDLGCNIIRCWGGNIYPDDNLFDYCDAHGIMVWQDFSMACGCYPNDERTCALIRNEAEKVVTRLRNHACVILWSGDNECDQSAVAKVRCDETVLYERLPDDNMLTRKVIPDVLREFDGTRPYIPSSPYIDNEAYINGNPAEQHFWGPRDFFKGSYYMNADAHFVSETGYHGCPSVQSLKKMIDEEHLPHFGDREKCTDIQWLCHATAPIPVPGMPHTYRIGLMSRQIEVLFGYIPENIETYSLLSRISQAEAFKFFIEHSRIQKWHRTGVIWWNVIDGWAQVSDAVVDWYGDKKPAYDYIKKSQMPFCMMCDEPKDGLLDVYAVNDLREDVFASYVITDLAGAEETVYGTVFVPGDGKEIAVRIPYDPDSIYEIRWQTGKTAGSNHFTCGIPVGLDAGKYCRLLKLKVTE